MTTRGGTARRPNQVRAQRRGTAWDDRLFTGELLTPTLTISRELALNVSDTEKRGLTVQRVIVHLFWNAASTGTDGVQMLTVGLATVSDDAHAAAAYPDADEDADFPVSGWMWRDRFALVSATIGGNLRSMLEIKQDLRVARKLDRSSLVLLLKTNAVSGTTFITEITGIVRVLYKLP